MIPSKVTNTHRITLRLPPQLFSSLKALAKKEGVTTSEAIRYLLEKGLKE
jgi:predicted DNA-binding protein